MAIHFQKSIFDPADAGVDGLRVLATRFWPRGVKKEAADLYLPDLAPSKELVRAFKAGELAWPAFKRKYVQEMRGQTSLLRTLRWLDRRGEDVTLLCACDDPDRCHRSLLAALVAKAD